MKIAKSEIADKLNKLKGVVPTKPTVAVLGGVLFKDGTITASNLNLTVRASISAQAEQPFVLTQKGIDIITSLPDGMVEIVPEDGRVAIKMPGIRNRVHTLPAEDFPEPAEISEATSIGIDSEAFTKAIGAMAYAVSPDGTKPLYTGVLFRGNGEKLDLVGCDGYRLAWNTVEYGEEVDMVVPKDSLLKALSLGAKDDTKIRYDRRHAVFSMGEYTVYTSLLEGNFMDYEKAFPTEGDPVEVDRRTLLEAVQRASLFTDKQNALKLYFRDDIVTVSVASPTGEYTEDCQLLGNYTKELTTAFNPKYLQEALKASGEDVITLTLTKALSPMVVTSGTLKSLVLPVKLREQTSEA